jgi:H+/gluconate symporter-like permease
LTIALDALGATYLQRAAQIGMNPALLHRVAVIGAGTLDSVPHSGAVASLRLRLDAPGGVQGCLHGGDSPEPSSRLPW